MTHSRPRTAVANVDAASTEEQPSATTDIGARGAAAEDPALPP
eukprot:CAMPEP_0194295982 /NCGR_PEP_ID=MMETSP0169-20130528/54853_1 /TAXON_ID=218684 /ORGANISM="Corethron pennatum, Strain L29A3" /LENGTH=42 /DNA_ID= /DNA_START= /DNA_END= /DNA_ORIENTATION=